MFTFTSDTVKGSNAKQETRQQAGEVFDRIRGNSRYASIFSHLEERVRQALASLDNATYKDIPDLVNKLKAKLLVFSNERAFTTTVEDKLRNATPIPLTDLAKYLGNDPSGRNAFLEKLARKVKELCESKGDTQATQGRILQARTAVSSGKHGLQESNVISLKPPNILLMNVYVRMLTRRLPAIATHRDGPEVIQQVALLKQQPVLQPYFVEIEKALIELDRYWASLKRDAQNECCKAVLAVQEVGKARGTLGELLAAIWAAKRKDVKPFNVGKHKVKFFQGQNVIDEQDYPQDIDVSYTYTGSKGQLKRVYVEAKYDMQTFLDKAADLQVTPLGVIPKQLYSYQLVRDRNKQATKITSPGDRRLELFISNSHDWLLLFIGENRTALEVLVDHQWKIVVAGNKISAVIARQVADKVDRLLDGAFRGSSKRSQKIKNWAREISKLYPTATSFLVATISTPLDPDAPSQLTRPTNTPLPNPWLLPTNPPHVPQAIEVFRLARSGGPRFLEKFQELVGILPDLGTLREIVRGLRLANPSILEILRSRGNLSSLNENEAWAVALVVQQVENELTYNRPRFLE